MLPGRDACGLRLTPAAYEVMPRASFRQTHQMLSLHIMLQLRVLIFREFSVLFTPHERLNALW